VECVTPAGNWSSWPPHKHDTARPGEAILEEIYYFEVAPEVPLRPRRMGEGFALQRLHVLAGPAPERTMAFCDDPAHHWVRESWEGGPVDPRLLS
jgi:5-deoxy-glucuronate isomerase